jgi:hypothetical protein
MSPTALKFGLRNSGGQWFTKGAGSFWLSDWTWESAPSYPFESWDLAEAVRLVLSDPGYLQVVKEGDP